MFKEKSEEEALIEFLSDWKDDPMDTKRVFESLFRQLSAMQDSLLGFNARPGITYSLRAGKQEKAERPLYVMVDVIDDDPEGRWLSVCFYGDSVEDPEELGDLIPGGLLGEDGYCFDLYGYDEKTLSYICRRIDEARSYMG